MPNLQQILITFSAHGMWTAYVAAVGSLSDPAWRESTIPARSDMGEPALLIRVPSLAQLPISDQQALDHLIAATP